MKPVKHNLYCCIVSKCARQFSHLHPCLMFEAKAESTALKWQMAHIVVVLITEVNSFRGLHYTDSPSLVLNY
jgi:hypothetical protein